MRALSGLEQHFNTRGDGTYQIRFSSIKAEEFAALNRSIDGFFMLNEVLEIFNLVGKLKDFKPRKFNPAWSREINHIERRQQKSMYIVERDRKSGFYSHQSIRLHGFALGFNFNDAINFDNATPKSFFYLKWQ